MKVRRDRLFFEFEQDLQEAQRFNALIGPFIRTETLTDLTADAANFESLCPIRTTPDPNWRLVPGPVSLSAKRFIVVQ